MKATMDETTRRRKIQEAHNKEHGITPHTAGRAVEDRLNQELPEEAKRAKREINKIAKEEYPALIRDLTAQMELASANFAV